MVDFENNAQEGENINKNYVLSESGNNKYQHSTLISVRNLLLAEILVMTIEIIKLSAKYCVHRVPF